MASTPRRPDEKPEVLNPETERILRERDITFEQDKLTARDAREVIAESRRKLKQPAPR
ncbi:MAG: hypothetical protein JO033_19990 [Acidobacteriaceae bacterium]|nr:hypothetical protein [Acidobacteriaceae bacterium]MBV9500427.1 hypothetical protein [Acidobacteriaceae bacterium]